MNQDGKIYLKEESINICKYVSNIRFEYWFNFFVLNKGLVININIDDERPI